MEKFLFRCDVSSSAGTGHLRRSMVLANELKNNGATIFCLFRTDHVALFQDVETICDHIETIEWDTPSEKDALSVVRLCESWQADAAVIDHYRADDAYQKILYRSGISWLQFDNCSGKPLWSRWVIDPSLLAEDCGYNAFLKTDDAHLLLGPAYAFVRPEFNAWKSRIEFREKVQQILITFGGGDDRGSTVMCLDAIKNIAPEIRRRVLVSSLNPRVMEIKNWVDETQAKNVTLHVDEPEIAKQMVESDMAMTAGGMTTFETAAMGLPSIIVNIADNQERNARGWSDKGIAINLGAKEKLSPEHLQKEVSRLVHDANLRKSMSFKGKSLVDCMGAQRVARILLSSKVLKKRLT